MQLLHSKNAFLAVLFHLDWNQTLTNNNMGSQVFLRVQLKTRNHIFLHIEEQRDIEGNN